MSFGVQHETPGRLIRLEDAGARGEIEGVRRLTLARLKEIQDGLSHTRDLDARHQERTARIAPQPLRPTHTSLRQSLAVSCSSPPVKEGSAAQDVRLALQGETAGSQGVFE